MEDLGHHRRLRVALVSDTHGHLDARVDALVRDCDLAVHAGDVGAACVLDALRPRLGRVLAVRGNNDTAAKWPPTDGERLAPLPSEVRARLPGGELVVVHGHRHEPAAGRHRRLRGDFPNARAIVYGHSHRMICDQEAAPWVLNPGAAGRARTFGGPSCLVLCVAGARWKVEVFRFPRD